MKVYIFTEAFVDADNDLDLIEARAFADKTKAIEYLDKSAQNNQRKGYYEDWYETEQERGDVIVETYQSYYEHDDDEFGKHRLLTVKEVDVE